MIPTKAVSNSPAFSEPWFERWRITLGYNKGEYKRKIWELCWAMEILSNVGHTGGGNFSGKSGISFGCGLERIGPHLAGLGANMLFTDVAVNKTIEEHWLKTGQHCGGDLSKMEVSASTAGDWAERSEFQYYNMLDPIPKEWIGAFDFCYSMNSVDHIGSICQAQEFIIRSMKVLRPGGVAVYTSELALDGPEDAMCFGYTSFFRMRDIRHLVYALNWAGNKTLNLNYGHDWSKETIDREPFSDPRANHILISIAGCLVTSFGIVAIKS